jgi:hypothetical protein
MDIETVPAPLRERLGPEATGGLRHLLELSYGEWRADVITACTERFERRLVEEVASLRVQIAQTEAVLRRDMAEMGADIRREMVQMGADIRQEMAQMGADIRTEMAQMGAHIRTEMAQMGGDLRQEMGQMGSGIRQEIAAGRVEMLKWCFLFWIGQLVTIASILGITLRVIR